MVTLPSLSKPKLPLVLLLLLIMSYALYFSWYTINRHNTLNSYAADLSLIDQPMWNTVRGPGGFMELTWGSRQQPRLAEHFEPILVPLAFLFFLWDDVRILLIAQSLALALGALPVFWIARRQLSIPDDHLSITNWAALAFALVYLLYPHLQAANIADFHADPFVVTPLLLAFWYATERRWAWMWLWAVTTMATKETLPTLTAMLGLFLILSHYRAKPKCPIPPSQSPLSHGLALTTISIIWFFVATFLIVAPLAQTYFGAAGPIYFESRYEGGLAGFLPLLQDPARWVYVVGLLTAAGFLPLLAPELLILGLPVLVANLLSNFPGQYSGEQHYSAPLVVAFMLAAIYGTGRLINNISLREINGQPLRIAVLIGASLWLIGWSLSYHALHGWTPLSARLERYPINPAVSYLPELTGQIPSTAVVSASAALHPHVAHRQVAYVFPTVETADYLLIDVTDIPGVHPYDAYAKIRTLGEQGWRVLQARQGLLLAKKSAQANDDVIAQLSPEFFDFTRTDNLPSHPTPLLFGDGRLHLLGYDLNDDPDDGVSLRLYWRASDTLPTNLRLWPLIFDDTGQLVNDPGQTPLIAALWYPPSAWQPAEIIVTETLPQRLPDIFHVGIAVGPDGGFGDAARHYPIHALNEPLSAIDPDLKPVSSEPAHLNPRRWGQLATFRRQGPFLEQLPSTPTLRPLTATNTRFDPALHLTGFWLETVTPVPGDSVPVILRWVTSKSLHEDFTVFIHLLAADGRLVSQSDAIPTWLLANPTSQWAPNHFIFDRHTLDLPDDLPAGRYTLQLGLYHSQTLERLPIIDGGDTFVLGHLQIE